jgi:hypothetical protein
LDRLWKLSINTHNARAYFTEKYVLVLKLPKVKFLNNKLHCSDGPAIEFRGEGLYYWKGNKVPMKLITDPGSISMIDIEKYCVNAETRRAFIDKLGVAEFYKIMSNDGGLDIIDEDIDEQKNPMRLMAFKFEGETIQVLECICPSTGRVYNIYPPTQKSKNVWDAKADLFNHKNIYIRHGDVGLTKNDFDGDRPVMET